MLKTIASTLAVFVLGCSIASAEGPGDKVMFVIDQWRKPGSNNIGTADVTIDNGNDFAIKDIRVRCDYAMKATGKKIEVTQNVAVTVKAKAKQTFKKTKFPYIDQDAAQGACKVQSADKA